MKAPIVFDYLDVGIYLKEYYQYRKNIDKGFSYETWAAELNFNSRSFLRMMIVGKKKLTSKVVEALQRQLFDSKEKQEYFFCLVRYSQAGNTKDKHLYGQRMMQILKSQRGSLHIEDSDDFISDPLLPRLLSLFSYEDLEKSIFSFSQILNVSVERVTKALALLKKLGLAEEVTGSEEWRSQVNTFIVPDNKGSLNLRKFHEKSLQEALHAFDLPKETRSYKSLLLPMNNEEFHLFLQNLNEFSGDQVNRHNSNKYRGKRLFQVNFNIYPVADELAENSTTCP